MTVDALTLQALVARLDSLDAVTARLDALEQRNMAFEHENARLRALIVNGTDEYNGGRPGEVAAEPTSALHEQVSRRGVLRRAASVAAGTVAAGVLLQRETQEAAAGHSSDVDANRVFAHYVSANNLSGTDAIYGTTNSPVGFTGVTGWNLGAGAGTHGYSAAGIGVSGFGVVGMKGTSGTPGNAATQGVHTNDGPGVVGDGHGTNQAGVLGRNSAGVGIRGEGKTGVQAIATNGNGVYGASGSGYGAVLKGGRAAIRLVPRSTIGKPTTGNHQVGELVLDKVGTLFICSVAGTPGTWMKVSTTTA